jgi:ABC-type transporter Mla MlaB component
MSSRAPHTVVLDGEMTILTASDQFQRLGQALTAGSELHLDLSGVTEFDTAGLQLLLLARREAERVGSVLTFLNPSEPVQDVLRVVWLGEET